MTFKHVILSGILLASSGLAGCAGGYVAYRVPALVWVYYSAQVLFLGAEFTRAYACRFGSMCAPDTDHLG